MTATLGSFPVFRALDADGAPLVGGLLYSFSAGTLTPLATYVDAAGVTTNANPVVLDSTGSANVWFGSSAYKLVLKTSTGSTLWTVDNYQPDAGSIQLRSDLASTASTALGDWLVGFEQSNSSGVLAGAVARTVHQKLQESVSVLDFAGVYNDGTNATSTTSGVQAAISAAKTQKCILFVPPGTYAISGSTPLSIDLGLMSMVGGGNVIFDCSAMTNTYAIQVFASQTFPANYLNSQNKLSAIAFTGNQTTGQHGILVGHATHDLNNQILIEGCAFHQFDRNLEFTTNSWRVKFDRCEFSQAKTYQVYYPAGVTNSGEAMSFYHCQFGNSETAPISVGCLGARVYLYSCSVLNVPISFSSVTAQMAMFGGNLENPGGGAGMYTYVTMSGDSSIFTLYGTSVVTNKPAAFATITVPLFLCTNANSSFVFDSILWPDTTVYEPEGTTGFRTWVSSNGRVVGSGSGYWASGGLTKCPVSNASNMVRNGDFETGSTIGWTATPYGINTLTTVAITGTAGQFSCAAAVLSVGMTVTISGTLGGTGSISGYSNPTTYWIVATNGTTTFTLSTTNGGTGVTTTAGTPTGLTYTTLSTAVASATAKKNGTYGLLLAADAGGINFTQKVYVRPGQLLLAFCWYKVATAGTGSKGSLQVVYADANGATISTPGDSFTSSSWTIFGTSCSSYVPPGAITATVTINAQSGAVVWIDEVIVNLV